MEQKEQIEVYRQTIEALNAQNTRLKEELNAAHERIEEMERIANMPENGVQQAYKEMLAYCKEAKEARDQIRLIQQEMAVNKMKYMQALKESINELF